MVHTDRVCDFITWYTQTEFHDFIIWYTQTSVNNWRAAVEWGWLFFLADVQGTCDPRECELDKI